MLWTSATSKSLRPPPTNPTSEPLHYSGESAISLASSNVFSDDFRLSITLLIHVLITATFLKMVNKRETDPGWAYGTKVEGNNQCVQSKCSKVLAEVKAFYKEAFDKKKQAKEAMNNIPHFDDVVDLDEEVDDDELNTQKRHCPISSFGSTATNKNTKGPMHAYYNQSETGGKKNGRLVGTPQHKDVQKSLRADAVQKFLRWMYDAGVAFNAVTYDSVGPAIEAIARHGCGMKPPSYHEVQVPMLKLENMHTKKIMCENEAKKTTYRCSLMADGWRDRKGSALINFLVNTPRGSMFLESVGASSYSHTGDNMFILFDSFIKQVGPRDVVQVVIDSASNNVFAGKLVEEKYPYIYWTPCTTHCIDLIFEDIFKLPHLKRTLDKAITVNTYIYNRTLLLNMMREFTGQKDMVRLVKTRFATTFITLNCFKANKRNFKKKMFTSEQWNRSKFSKLDGGTHTANTILTPNFWNNIDIAVKIGCLLLSVLRLVDGERKPPMGYIYEAMDRAKEAIADAFKNKEDKYAKVFKISDRRWNCQLHQPLHAAEYYLNLALYYENPNVENDDEVMSGLMSCIHKLALNEDEEMKIHAELPIYRSAQWIFGNPIVKKMRVKIAPAEWWMQYGASTPALKKFAVKLHSKKRNRLEQQKLNDLVYIKYNRALRRRYNMRDTIDPIILDDANVIDPTEWLMGGEEEEEDAPVFEGIGGLLTSPHRAPEEDV
ncbi:unnamed protein product [Lactuca saligna]|uniref:DUF659 domain-containing protein n=1 Tax=Lactuca saligna TaxID=75948 RepID=A0AA36A3Y4_LACSI|nr:unnamed protein product [Lactuca saligna]